MEFTNPEPPKVEEYFSSRRDTSETPSWVPPCPAAFPPEEWNRLYFRHSADYKHYEEKYGRMMIRKELLDIPGFVEFERPVSERRLVRNLPNEFMKYENASDLEILYDIECLQRLLKTSSWSLAAVFPWVTVLDCCRRLLLVTRRELPALRALFHGPDSDKDICYIWGRSLYGTEPKSYEEFLLIKRKVAIRLAEALHILCYELTERILDLTPDLEEYPFQRLTANNLPDPRNVRPLAQLLYRESYDMLTVLIDEEFKLPQELQMILEKLDPEIRIATLMDHFTEIKRPVESLFTEPTEFDILMGVSGSNVFRVSGYFCGRLRPENRERFLEDFKQYYRYQLRTKLWYEGLQQEVPNFEVHWDAFLQSERQFRSWCQCGEPPVGYFVYGLERKANCAHIKDICCRPIEEEAHIRFLEALVDEFLQVLDTTAFLPAHSWFSPKSPPERREESYYLPDPTELEKIVEKFEVEKGRLAMKLLKGMRAKEIRLAWINIEEMCLFRQGRLGFPIDEGDVQKLPLTSLVEDIAERCLLKEIACHFCPALKYHFSPQRQLEEMFVEYLNENPITEEFKNRIWEKEQKEIERVLEMKNPLSILVDKMPCTAEEEMDEIQHEIIESPSDKLSPPTSEIDGSSVGSKSEVDDDKDVSLESESDGTDEENVSLESDDEDISSENTSEDMEEIKENVPMVPSVYISKVKQDTDDDEEDKERGANTVGSNFRSKTIVTTNITHRTDVPGVSYDDRKEAWNAQWYDSKTGRLKHNYFYISEWGYEEALQKAIEKRKEAETKGWASLQKRCDFQSGVKGVNYDKTELRWRAKWNDKGRQMTKNFKVADYGEGEEAFEKAKLAAIEYRRTMEEKVYVFREK